MIGEGNIEPPPPLSNNQVSSSNTLVPILINKMVKLKENIIKLLNSISLSQSKLQCLSNFGDTLSPLLSISLIVYLHRFQQIFHPLKLSSNKNLTTHSWKYLVVFVIPFFVLIISINCLIITNVSFLVIVPYIKAINALIPLPLIIFTFQAALNLMK